MLVKLDVIKLKGLMKFNKTTYAILSENTGIEFYRVQAIMRGSMQPKLKELNQMVEYLKTIHKGLEIEDLCIWSDGSTLKK